MRQRDCLGAALWMLAAAGMLVAALAGGDIRHYRSVMYAGVALAAICLLVHGGRALRRAPGRVEDAIGARRAWHQAQENTARMDGIEARQGTCEARVAALLATMDQIGRDNGATLPATEAAGQQPRLRCVREEAG